MPIITRQMQTADLRDVDLCNDPFMIESHLALPGTEEIALYWYLLFENE
jgi:hypothetical protein